MDCYTELRNCPHDLKIHLQQLRLIQEPLSTPRRDGPRGVIEEGKIIIVIVTESVDDVARLDDLDFPAHVLNKGVYVFVNIKRSVSNTAQHQEFAAKKQ